MDLKEILTKEFLIDNYENKKMSLNDIKNTLEESDIKTTVQTIYRYSKKLGINIRSFSESRRN